MDPRERIKTLRDRQSACLERLDALLGGEGPRARALFMYVKGKALDVTDEHVPEAEQLLGKAVKLDPSLGDGWNQVMCRVLHLRSPCVWRVMTQLSPHSWRAAFGRGETGRGHLTAGSSPCYTRATRETA